MQKKQPRVISYCLHVPPCEHCKKNQAKHVNDIRAKSNKYLLLGGLIISLIFTVLLWNVFGGIATLTFMIPIIIWQQQSNSVNAFNKYRIRR